IALCFLTTFVATIPTAVTPPASSNRLGVPPFHWKPSTSTRNINNLTSHTLRRWPREWTKFHISRDLYFQVRVYGLPEEDISESEVLEGLEMIGLDIDTGGDGDPSGQVSEVAYRWDQILLILGDVRVGTTWLTGRQASALTDYLAGLTMLYGPQELRAFGVQDRATGRVTIGALHFINRQSTGQL
ncbi:MAG: hypothetical protein Q9181_003767, partial [Wetmoreana brouardii]